MAETSPVSVTGRVTAPDKDRSWANVVRSNVLAATGVLLVVPALLNAGYDIYAAAMKLPRTETERTNDALFRKYFNKPPVAVMPVPVKHSAGTVEVKFSIYEEGDVYVEYGQNTQWFPLPKSSPSSHAGLSLISSAFAQSTTAVQLRPTTAALASQRDELSGGVLLRSRTFADGRGESLRIDIRTGEILSREASDIKLDRRVDKGLSPRMIKSETIDIKQLRLSAAGG